MSDNEELVDEPPEGEDEVIADNPLSGEVAGRALSLLCKTANGLSHAYVRLDVHEQNLTDITVIEKFSHLRYVDVSNNYLTDIQCMKSLNNLLVLNAERNKLETLNLSEFPYLQVANFSNNRLSRMDLPRLPALTKLVIAGNEIEEISALEDSKFPALQHLDLHGNKLKSTAGIKLQHLERLYLGGNKIEHLEDLDCLKRLTTLHIRDNQIASLSGFTESMESLQYLNLRGNPIPDISEVKKLQCLPMLRALVLVDCPVSDMDDFRIEVLIPLRQLERLDKEPYTSDERVDAEEIAEQRKQEATAEDGEQ